MTTMMMILILMTLRVIQNVLEHPRDRAQSFYFNANSVIYLDGTVKSCWCKVLLVGSDVQTNMKRQGL